MDTSIPVVSKAKSQSEDDPSVICSVGSVAALRQRYSSQSTSTTTAVLPYSAVPSIVRNNSYSYSTKSNLSVVPLPAPVPVFPPVPAVDEEMNPVAAYLSNACPSPTKSTTSKASPQKASFWNTTMQVSRSNSFNGSTGSRQGLAPMIQNTGGVSGSLSRPTSPRGRRAEIVQHTLQRSRSTSAERFRPSAQELIESAVLSATAKAVEATVNSSSSTTSSSSSSATTSISFANVTDGVVDGCEASIKADVFTEGEISVAPVQQNSAASIAAIKSLPSHSKDSAPPKQQHRHHDLSKLNTVANKIRRCRSASIPKEWVLPNAIETDTDSVISTKKIDQKLDGTVHNNVPPETADDFNEKAQKPNESDADNKHTTKTTTITASSHNLRNMNLKHWSRRQQKASTASSKSTSVPTHILEEGTGTGTKSGIEAANNDDNNTIVPTTDTNTSSVVNVVDILASKRAYMLSRVGKKPSLSSLSSSSRSMSAKRGLTHNIGTSINNNISAISIVPSSSSKSNDTESSNISSTIANDVSENSTSQALITPTIAINRKSLMTKKANRLIRQDAVPATNATEQPTVVAIDTQDKASDVMTEEILLPPANPIKKTEMDLIANRRAYLATLQAMKSSTSVSNEKKKAATSTTTAAATTTRSSSVPSQRPTPQPLLMIERTLLATALIPPIRGRIKGHKKTRSSLPNNIPVHPTSVLNEGLAAIPTSMSNIEICTTTPSKVEMATTSEEIIPSSTKSKITTPSMSSTEKRNRAKQLISTRRSTTSSLNGNIVVPSIHANTSSKSGSFDFSVSSTENQFTTTREALSLTEDISASRAIPALSIDTTIAAVSAEEYVALDDTTSTAEEEDVHTDIISTAFIPMDAATMANNTTKSHETTATGASGSEDVVSTSEQQDEVEVTRTTLSISTDIDRARGSSIDTKIENRMAKALRIRSKAPSSTPRTVSTSAPIIPVAIDIVDVNINDDDNTTETLLVVSNESTQLSTKCYPALSTEEVLTCGVTSISTRHDDDGEDGIATASIAESNIRTSILYDDSGDVVDLGPKQQCQDQSFSPTIEVLDKTSAWRANSSDEDDGCTIKDDHISAVESVSTLPTHGTELEMIVKQDKTEILRASSNEDLSDVIELPSLDFRSIVDEFKSEDISAIVESSWDTSKVLFNEFNEILAPNDSLQPSSWDADIVNELKGDNVEFSVPATSESTELMNTDEETALDPLGWPVKPDGLDTTTVVPVDQPCDENGDDDNLLLSTENKDSSSDEDFVDSSAVILLCMSKEERIKQYESMLPDEESSVDNADDISVEEVDDEPVVYLKHDGEVEEEEDIGCSTEQSFYVFDNASVQNESFAIFEPSFDLPSTGKEINSSMEMVPSIETLLSDPSQVESVLPLSSPIGADIPFNPSSGSLSLLPPPPPPPGSKKKKTRRSDGSKVVPLLSPPPEEKIRKWQDQKTRQIDRLEKMKCKMDNFIALVDSNCFIAEETCPSIEPTKLTPDPDFDEDVLKRVGVNEAISSQDLFVEMQPKDSVGLVDKNAGSVQTYQLEGIVDKKMVSLPVTRTEDAIDINESATNIDDQNTAPFVASSSTGDEIELAHPTVDSTKMALDNSFDEDVCNTIGVDETMGSHELFVDMESSGTIGLVVESAGSIEIFQLDGVVNKTMESIPVTRAEDTPNINESATNIDDQNTAPFVVLSSTGDEIELAHPTVDSTKMALDNSFDEDVCDAIGVDEAMGSHELFVDMKSSDTIGLVVKNAGSVETYQLDGIVDKKMVSLPVTRAEDAVDINQSATNIDDQNTAPLVALSSTGDEIELAHPTADSTKMALDISFDEDVCNTIGVDGTMGSHELFVDMKSGDTIELDAESVGSIEIFQLDGVVHKTIESIPVTRAEDAPNINESATNIDDQNTAPFVGLLSSGRKRELSVPHSVYSDDSPGTELELLQNVGVSRHLGSTCADHTPEIKSSIDNKSPLVDTVMSDVELFIATENRLSCDTVVVEAIIFDPLDMSNDPATLRGTLSMLSTPSNNPDLMQRSLSVDQETSQDTNRPNLKAECMVHFGIDKAIHVDKHYYPEEETEKEVVCFGFDMKIDDLIARRMIKPPNNRRAFDEALMIDPSILSSVLNFLGDPVVVCRMKMVNKACFNYITEHEHKLMRDAVRLGGMCMSVRPSFWIWVTLCKGQSPVASQTMFDNSVNEFHDSKGNELSELERQGREGKWFHVIGRDVSRAFGTLPPHKTGARLRTDSIVRALVTWGRSRMMNSGVKGSRDKAGLSRGDETTPSDEVSISPTDTVSDWGAVTPVGSFNGSFTSSNSDQPGFENGTKAASRNRQKKHQSSDELEFALGTSTLTEAMKVTLQQKLSYILHALAAAHPEVGYCQGMDYLVAHLLRMLQDTIRWQAAHGNLPPIINSAPDMTSNALVELSGIYAEIDRSLVVEETCFRVMNSFFTTYSLQHFYWPELRCLKTCCRVFEKIIQLKLPVLADHFEHHELNVGLFALGWFQTLFLYLPSMPSATVCHMWDIWLVERSFKIFFRVGTAILFLSQPILLNHELEGMMGYLNTFPDATLLSPDILIACSLQIKITNRMLMELEQEVKDCTMTC